MKTLIYVLLLQLLAIGAMGQDSTAIHRQRKAQADSMAKAEQRRSEQLSNLKSKENDAEAKAKEAQKVERDATAAA